MSSVETASPQERVRHRPMGDELVFIDVVEKKSRRFRRVRVPSLIVRIATLKTEAA